MSHSVPLPALVLPDVHHEFERVEAIIAEHGKDCASVVFLGDYFDSFEKTSTVDLHLTARWLLRSLQDPRRHHLFGNHDVAYFFPGEDTFCSGWTPERQQAFDEAFGPKGPPVDRLNLALSAGRWLLSHAGFSGGKLRDVGMDALLHWADHAKQSLSTHTPHPLTACGRTRGGTAKRGGLFWLDWDDEFVPLPGIHQLVGHTLGKTIRGRHLGKKGNIIARPIINGELTPKEICRALPDAHSVRSMNLCLDTALASWAVIFEDCIDLHCSDALPEGVAEVVVTSRSPTGLPPVHAELIDLGLHVEWDDNPSAFVRWVEIERALPSAEAVKAFREIVKLDRSHTQGPSPAEAARGVRVLRRKQLLK